MVLFLKKNRKRKLDVKAHEQNLREYSELQAKYNELKQRYQSSQTEYAEINQTIENLKKQENEIKKSIDTKSLEFVDQLDGLGFEEYVRKLLIKLGYSNVQKTKASGDYGIDILAEKDNVTYAIQCKLYSSKLGNDCVQEACAGKKYYKKDLAVVITNSTFTQGAIELAKETNVVLWDRKILDNMLQKINRTFEPCNTLKNERGENSCYDDPLYNEIVSFAVSVRKISASLIQRKYKIGYNRASRLIDMLEQNGVIGPQNGSNPREVLVKIEDN